MVSVLRIRTSQTKVFPLWTEQPDSQWASDQDCLGLVNSLTEHLATWLASPFSPKLP